MIYPNNFEQTIGFATLRNEISKLCISEMGKVCCKKMSFLTDFNRIASLLNSVNEFKTINAEGKDFPVSYYFDLRQDLKQIQVPGSFLSSKSCYDLRRNLRTIDEILRFFKNENAINHYPTLYRLCNDLDPLYNIAAVIDSIIDVNGDIADNASPLLFDLRRAIARAKSSVSGIMQRIIAQGKADGYIDKDTTPNVRDGRLVIPVSPMNKRKLRGIIHDESATGKTLFIEPEEIVEANNRIREAEGEERREIVRILTELTAQIRPEIDVMLKNSSILGKIDFTRAKSIFAANVGGTLPHLHKEPLIEWYHAIHPTLLLALRQQGKDVVPLNIELNETQRIVLISGPNAGGKSVCLKTVGVVQYMLQCGVLPTVYDNSHMGVFSNIMVDIGDQQSIEDDLSTYSSHLKNMKTFMQKGDNKSLILIDEMGSGTEPQIGGAIAQAILKQLNEKQVMGVVTTHYHNLKNFAQDADGIVNGAMLYDRQAMSPLFQLSIGYPGSSFAIEIAQKMGLPGSVIQDAEAIVGNDYIKLDRYLLDIIRDRKYWEKKRHEIRLKEKRIDNIINDYNSRLDKLSDEKRLILKEAKSSAQEILSQSNAQIEQTIREIKEAQADKEKTRLLRQQLDEFKQRLNNQEDTVIENFKPLISQQNGNKQKKQKQSPISVKKSSTGATMKPGSYVLLKGTSSVGEIISIDEKYAVVAFGSIKSRVETSRIEPTLQSPKQEKVSGLGRQTVDEIRERQLNFKTEIDVRGFRADEAIQAVMYFIDDAVQFSYHRVRILHGTGTGALKQSIRQYLNTLPGVKSYHDEHVQLGGAGITIVNLE